MIRNPRARSAAFVEFRGEVARHINIQGTRGLEIGAFDRPVFTKEEASVAFLDYRTTDEARAYAAKAPGHDPDFVVPIDYVVGGSNDWHEVPDASFDWVISCHALEHCPNLIGMMRIIGKKMKPGGILISNLPDKRATFDVFRPLSTLGQIVEDFILDRHAPSVQAVFDHIYYTRGISQADAWALTANTLLENNRNFDLAFSQAKLSLSRYHDAHRYVFTSESFLAIMTELCASQMIPFSTYAHQPTKPGTMSFVNYLVRTEA
jgi:SAM-dependent methyltransferase